MEEPSGTSAVIIGLLGTIAGFMIRYIWERYAGWTTAVPLETWKIRARVLEARLSSFYWPLYECLVRDEVIWRKVFIDLNDSRKVDAPPWKHNLTEKRRQELNKIIQAETLVPNHREAVKIIRSYIHLADADQPLLDLLNIYIRHVDVYVALRSSDIWDIDPIDVGEPYPQELFGEIWQKLQKTQSDYDRLLREKGLSDIPNDIHIGYNKIYTRFSNWLNTIFRAQKE